MKHTLVLNLRPAPWRSETELGEAGIMTDWEVLDENGNKIGSYVEWWDGTSGLFIGEYPKVTRVVLPRGFAKRVWTETN